MPELHPTRGSGVVVALGVLASTVVLAGVCLVAVDVLRWADRTQVAADLAALAAMDVSAGLVPGRPCVIAREIGRQHGVQVVLCEVESSRARVIAMTNRRGLVIEKRAQAGFVRGGVWSD